MTKLLEEVTMLPSSRGCRLVSMHVTLVAHEEPPPSTSTSNRVIKG
jgi:hypothetical protein